MNPYELLMQGLQQEQQPQKVKVGLDAFNNVDVAENIGHDKLKKKPYNPYGLITEQLPEAEIKMERPNNFNKEMLRDALK